MDNMVVGFITIIKKEIKDEKFISITSVYGLFECN